MNNIDDMPAKCKACPYWEACEYPYICQDTEPKLSEIGNINAEFAENPQDRLTDGLIWKHDALDAIHCNITVTGRQNAELVAETIGAFADRIKALPTVQPDEKLEKCRFEYINACRIVTFSTPDTTKKDISDAYAVIKVLQPIFGDVTF